MALDRQSIEKKDFPVGRRGYDPDAVDAHLSTLADEISELKRSARKRSDTLASSASDQVRAIVEAAESSAADIQRDAEAEAREIRDEANSEAQATREQATEQARDYVGKVSESTDTMLGRLGSMQAELDGLVDSLRTGTGRLSADLKELESSMSEVRGVVAPRPDFEPEAPTDGAIAADGELPAGQPGDMLLAQGESTPVAAAETPDVLAAGTDTADGIGADSTDGAAAINGFQDQDSEGARLIALNMALNGTPREETAQYLSENFTLTDADGLLDEVYSSVED